MSSVLRSFEKYIYACNYHHRVDLEHFHHPEVFLVLLPSLTPSTALVLGKLPICLLTPSHISESTWHVLFCVQLL